MTSSVSSTSGVDTSVRLFTQTVENTPNATIAEAHNIGVLIQNKSELNVQGALATSTDKSDSYSFKVRDRGNSTLNTTLTTNERVQLMSTGGRIIADNNGTTTQKSAFDDWTNGKLQLNSGTYIMKVSRAVTTSPHTQVPYSLTISQGSYSQDYVTKAVEQSSATSTTSAAVTTNSNIAAMLSGTLTGLGASSNSTDNISTALSNLFATLGANTNL